MAGEARVLWRPAPGSASALADYRRWLSARRALNFNDYADLWRWSVTELEAFWGSLWEYFDVVFEGEPEPVLTSRSMPGADWFPRVRLNYAENALRDGPDPAVIFRDEAGRRAELTYAGLRQAVANVRQQLLDLGVEQGDRVAAYVPNCPAALVLFLATASLGAVWSSCPPEFGAQSVLDRFRQISPKVFCFVRGYSYGGKHFDRTEPLREIAASLPSVVALISVDNQEFSDSTKPVYSYTDISQGESALEFARVPFGHPLWILYSSGTTGLPKPIVHGHGGILLEHLKVLRLHSDLRPGDRFFWYSTTGWMMWNYLISGLLVNATVVLFDGSPGYPDLNALWRMAEAEQLTYFGTSAPYLMACCKAGLRPGETFDLSALRGIGSTGAPLPEEGFVWVYEAVAPQVLLGSVSGGTDLCTAFVCCCPELPVIAGELQCRALGAKVEAFTSQGQPVVEQLGELVITEPMPSMPVYFWGDEDGRRYQESYFDVYPGVWRHGDWIHITARGSAVITGRSDATLNRGGVRMGTSDFYRVVEALPEIADSVVVELREELWLFVVPSAGTELDAALRQKLHEVIRGKISPRHVPDYILPIRTVPRTLSGKKLEVPIRRILEGSPVADTINLGTLAHPAAIEELLEAVREHRISPAPSG